MGAGGREEHLVPAERDPEGAGGEPGQHQQVHDREGGGGEQRALHQGLRPAQPRTEPRPEHKVLLLRRSECSRQYHEPNS